jgi:nucleoside-diphosphate-sugar epimerase
MTTVAVTGAAGYLGRPLCARLVREGHAVRALVRDPSSFAMPGVQAVRCELPDGIDAEALAGADVLVHAAYATRETDVDRARRVNEDGTRRLLAAARAAGARTVFVSTIDARPDAPSYYARSKHTLEALLSPDRDLVLRPGFILAPEGRGRFQELVGAMRSTHVVPLFGGGHQPLQTVHVDDVGEALVRALARGITGAVNVAEPEPVSLGAFLRMTAARAGIRCLFVPLPFGPILAGLRVVESLRLPFPLRAESLLGMRGLRVVPVAADLARLDLRVRPAAESLAAIFE